MFKYNPGANYQPNGGRYLQVLSGQDLYKQTIVVSARDDRDTFPARFPNIFVDYPLGQMRVGDKLWTHWNKARDKKMRVLVQNTTFLPLLWCTNAIDENERFPYLLFYQ